jgi:hypothetical protein
MLWKILTHVHTSSTFCGYQVGSKGKAVAQLEKEKGEKVRDRTLAAGWPDSPRESRDQSDAGLAWPAHLVTYWEVAASCDWKRRERVWSALTYDDVRFTGTRREEEKRLDARARQVIPDLTRPVSVFTQKIISGNDLTPCGTALGQSSGTFGQLFDCAVII